MNVVMGETIFCEEVEMKVPVTPLSTGRTHASMEAALKAMCESIGLELVEYGGFERHTTPAFVRFCLYARS